MHAYSTRTLTVVAILAVTLTAGCQTTGGVQDQSMAGAGVGALVGAGIGALITGDARGAAAGAAIGGLLGYTVIAINQYQANQVRSYEQDNRIYALSTPIDRTQVRIRKGTSAPRSVKRGETVDIVTDYSVLLPPNTRSAEVTESWLLKKDGQTVAKLPAKTSQRTAGGWAAKAGITIPSNVAAGTYVIEHQVNSGSSYDAAESTFVVRG